VAPVSGCVPEIIAVNEKTMAFLSGYRTGEKLRGYVRRTLDYERLIEPARQLAQLQVSMEKLDLPLNIERVSRRVLVQAAETALKSSGHDPGRITAIEQAFERLFSVFGVSLEHGDFQDNNVLLPEFDGNYSILDWGDAVVSCPVFSLATYLHAAQLAHEGLRIEVIESIAKVYGKVWGLSISQLEQSLEDCHLVYPLVSLFKTLRLDKLGRRLPAGLAGLLARYSAFQRRIKQSGVDKFVDELLPTFECKLLAASLPRFLQCFRAMFQKRHKGRANWRKSP
jgi:hypothetical protein